MRGLHTSLVIVVAAIVILIVALVVLSIFGIGIQTFTTMVQAESFCVSQCQVSCSTTQTMPLTWNAQSVMVGTGAQAVKKSCATVVAVTSCTGKCAPPS